MNSIACVLDGATSSTPSVAGLYLLKLEYYETHQTAQSTTVGVARQPSLPTSSSLTQDAIDKRNSEANGNYNRVWEEISVNCRPVINKLSEEPAAPKDINNPDSALYTRSLREAPDKKSAAKFLSRRSAVAEEEKLPADVEFKMGYFGRCT